MKLEHWQLEQRRAEPLDIKILMSTERIRQWYQHFNGEVYVAFSGGLDSTVLLHLVRSIYPDVPAVFNNTGVEYPEIVKFVRSTENVQWIRPKKRFQRIVQEYGYPVASKRISHIVREIRTTKSEKLKTLRLTGYRPNGKYHSAAKLPQSWSYLLSAPFKISDQCCYHLKKAPAARVAKQFGCPLLGMRASEGRQRQQQYLQHGCNAYDTKIPHSWPLAFWTDQDVQDYIAQYQVPYSPIYDMGYTRTGCFPCMFGVHLEGYPNRFQRMHDTHPKLWTYCMDTLGIREVLAYIGVPAEPWM